MRRILLLLLLLLPLCGLAEDDEELHFADLIDVTSEEAIEIDAEVEADTIPEAGQPVNSAREDFIERIIDLGYELYLKADGRAQSAHFKGDIYLCKNFTTHIFNELRDDFCMAEYPDVRLRIPNNLPKEDCRPYYYGLAWQDVDAEDGNPFYAAAEFRYDASLTYEENFQLACEFMRQAQRGDFFQMSADYEYGTGAHSAIMMGYDPDADEIHWMDSNMRGHSRTVNGEKVRYGICQYDEVRSVEWWAEAFCHKGRGATLYRLRDDIQYRDAAD
ncbi:MAG: hypothetical protein IJE07_09045 [Clostridia bacterium]|nr:hypothetical protein [Clostridia bacterium]